MSSLSRAPRSRFLGALALAVGAAPAVALDHGEAPLVSRSPKVDGTDLFVFRSYEPGREDFVTLIACYQPFQDPFAGPDYFLMDPEALYEIHVDRTGDGVQDLSIRFQFSNTLQAGASAPTPLPGGMIVPTPVFNAKPFSFMIDPPEASIRQTYTVEVVNYGGGGGVTPLTSTSGDAVFVKPGDNVGTRSFADYESYALGHVYDLAAPAHFGRVFVGQRKDPRAISMGALYDLVNLNLVGPATGGTNDLAGKNVTALAIEVPVSLLGAAQKIIGVWSTASTRAMRVLASAPDFDEAGTTSGRFVQISRTGAPLVNSLFIGFRDKDRFNASKPVDDGQYLDYFDFPAFSTVIAQETGLGEPTSLRRSDLRDYFLTGVPGLTQGSSMGEMLRFKYAVNPVDPAQQKPLGVLDGDMAGYPNGRRPGDDVVDITLRILMGANLPPAQAPSGALALTDGVATSALDFYGDFPYLVAPAGGTN